MTTKFQGIPLTLGGEVFVVPPLNFRSLQALQARLDKFTGGVDADSINVVIDATYEALKRNYPEFDKDSLHDLLDVANMGEVMEAVMDVSGLKRKAHEAEVKEASANPSIGPSSTPT
jgi:hypothetical protein